MLYWDEELYWACEELYWDCEELYSVCEELYWDEVFCQLALCEPVGESGVPTSGEVSDDGVVLT